MKVIIAGSRCFTFDNYDWLEESIQESGFEITKVISGDAKGVDRLGEQWAYLQGIPCEVYPADWDEHGKKAGILRNIEMGDYADALIALWDGESKGTKHMIDYMTKLGKPVHVDIMA